MQCLHNNRRSPSTSTGKEAWRRGAGRPTLSAPSLPDPSPSLLATTRLWNHRGREVSGGRELLNTRSWSSSLPRPCTFRLDAAAHGSGRVEERESYVDPPMELQEGERRPELESKWKWGGPEVEAGSAIASVISTSLPRVRTAAVGLARPSVVPATVRP